MHGVAHRDAVVILSRMENALQAQRNRAARFRAARQAALNAMQASREAPVTNLDSAEMQSMPPADQHPPDQEPAD
jgi:hypothetical protein